MDHTGIQKPPPVSRNMTQAPDMNTRTYLLTGSFVVIVLFLTVSYLFSGSKTVAPNPSPAELPMAGSAAPTSGTSSGQSVVISTSGGGTVAVNNILNDPNTIADPTNQGYYYVGYHPAFGATSTTTTAGPVPYLIEYISATSYFNIEILQEPIGATRLAAEAYLAQHLGISQGSLCQLNYMVSVPYWVNQTYAGKNLGFSFCPGATVLP